MNWTDRNHERNGASHRPVVLCCADATPAAIAVPLTGQPPRELAETDTVPVSRTTLAAGRVLDTDRIVEMIRELSLTGPESSSQSKTSPGASSGTGLKPDTLPTSLTGTGRHSRPLSTDWKKSPVWRC